MTRILAAILALLAGAASPAAAAPPAEGKKVLYVDSYHAEYEPSIAMHEAVDKILPAAGVEVRYVYLDAKRHKEEGELQEAALRVKALIESWEPDAVIVADDAASKYLVQPYFRDAELPFVFIGVNWEVEPYGFPCRNVTGQIEVELVNELLAQLRNYARGDRIGFLSGRTLTDQKALEYYRKVFGIHFDKVMFADDFAGWKKAFRSLQGEVDLLLMRNNSGIAGWNDAQAAEVVMTDTAIPSGTVSSHLHSLVLISYAKVQHEMGEYAAQTILEILGGKSPAEIPVSSNRQVKVYLNMRLAKKLGTKFPMELIEKSHLVSVGQQKLFYVNSYHHGYAWSDDVEKGLLKALQITARDDGTFDTSGSPVELRVFRMDTKVNKSEDYKKQAALAAKAVIDEWRPDVVVVSDDNAVKYLVVPYLMNGEVPVVFCGVNWDASIYGLPTASVTGMVEVAPVHETLELLRPYSRGDRLGFVGANTLTEHKNVDAYREILGVKFADGRLVDDYAQWQAEYLRLQDSVDMLLFFTAVGVDGWDDDRAEAFILANTKIPSAGTGDHQARFTLLGNVRIAEEQGWWAGKTALRILEGTPPAEIPVARNQGSTIYLNMALARKLGVKFPVELMQKANFINAADR